MEKEINPTLSSVSEKTHNSDLEHEPPLGADAQKTGTNEIDWAARASSAPHPQPPAPPPAHPVQDPIPNGGTQAWLQVLGSWASLVATWGLVSSFGVFQTYYEEHLLATESASSISWIGSIQACLLMVLGPVVGPLYDAGYFRHLLIAGQVLVVVGMFLTSLGTEYWHILLAQGVCVGLGMGLFFLPATAIIAQYFTTRRALAVGISSTGSPLAGIVFPIIFSNLVPRVGFGWATRVIAFILLGLAVVPVAFMRTRVPPAGKKRAMVDGAALRDPAFMLFVAAGFFVFLCLYSAFFYIQLFAQLRGLASVELAPYMVTLLNVGSVFGRLLPNYVADKLGSVNICVGCAAASAVLLYAWMGVHDLGGLVVFALLYGAFSGGIVSVVPSAVMTMSPDMSRVGTRMGMTFLVAGVSILIGTPIAGAILGDFSDSRWKGLMGYSAAGLTLGTFLYGAARVVLYRRNGRKIA